jgi:hypothetical protein
LDLNHLRDIETSKMMESDPIQSMLVSRNVKLGSHLASLKPSDALQKIDNNNKYRQQTQPILIDTNQTKPDSYSHRQQTSTSRLGSRNKKSTAKKTTTTSKAAKTQNDASCILTQIKKPTTIKPINKSNKRESIKSYVNRSTSINGCDLANGALSKTNGEYNSLFMSKSEVNLA